MIVLGILLLAAVVVGALLGAGFRGARARPEVKNGVREECVALADGRSEGEGENL